ncbi:MAG TPA: class I SAM-dependent methyltransferase [Polyangiaceae bacterium]|jgi:SAM-dependent methyltransferase|nr:class I SAM-dependent methyltransferase [Polyangiaceae bacterium]
MTEPMFFDFNQLFDADEYLYFMEDSLREENTPAQVDFLVDKAAMTPGMKVLDLGCGHGRHANELARRGYSVVGVDMVEGFLEVARKEAEQDGLDTTFVRGDMGAFQASGEYARVVCLFDAFGFFDDTHQLETLRCIHRALTDDGKLVLDLRTREWMIRLPACAVLDKGNGDMMIDRHHFDMTSGRFVDRRTYLRGGKQREVMFSVRLWAFTEIRLVMRSVGLELEAAYGGFDASAPSPNKPRMVLVAKKVPPPTLADFEAQGAR